MSRACKNCKLITEEVICPLCRGTELSDDYSSTLIILNPEKSQLAKKLEITEPGKYALKIR
jgi:DNA-directed RNA polymerase subunit E"